MRRNEKGFTLVELMVVLAILVLLAAVGVPQYMNVLERARIGRDLAQVAMVQSAFNAFMAETDWKDKLADAQQEQKLAEIEAESHLTGETVKFIEGSWEGELPELESKNFADADEDDWYVTRDGTVYVKFNGKTLPAVETT